MDREEALRLLKGGEEGVAKWNERRADGEQIADLSNANLSNARLIGADISGATLIRADISYADLSNANLSNARLNGADISGANLSEANLSDAELVRAELNEADLRYAKLRAANLSHANLRFADFRYATLPDVEVSNADFTKANFSFARLIGANLSGANLSEANLSKADLTGANLHGANLTGADLSSVNLTNANLSWAELRKTKIVNVILDGADLNRSRMSQTTLTFTSLARARGVESIFHEGPSDIGFEAIFESEMPEFFLRGCGVPETFMTYRPSLIGNAIEFYSCFISYSHTDNSFARRLHDQLQGRGIRCWLDEHEMLPGDDMYKVVDQGIRLWDKVLLCASKASLTSWWVDREVNTAIEKEQRIYKDRGKNVLAIIPLNLDGHLFEWDGAQAAELRRRLAADFTGWETDNAKFEEQFERVVKALRTDGGKVPPPKPKL